MSTDDSPRVFDSDDGVEKLLAEMPPRRMSEGDEAQILRAIQSAALDSGATPKRARWWAARVPLWQAAAACLVLTCSSFLLSRAISDGSKPGGSTAKGSARDTSGAIAEHGTLRPQADTALRGAAAIRLAYDVSVFAARPTNSHYADISQWGPIQWPANQKGN